MKKLSIFAFLAIALSAQSQSPILEKTYDVSKKAKRGFLSGVEFNKENETIDMYYMVSSFWSGAGSASSSMYADIPCEVYSYDKELNEKGSSKVGVKPDTYEWANFKGLFTIETVQGWFDLGGLNFKKGKFTLAFDPATGKYNPAGWKVTDKEKPKQGDGTKYSWMGGFGMYNVTAERSALMVLGKKVEKSDATKTNYLHYYNHLMKYDVVHCDIDLNTTITDSIDFEYAQSFSYTGQIKDDRIASNDEMARDWVLVFLANSLGPKFYYQASSPNIYNYVRISPKGKILEKIQFDSPLNLWRIEGAYEKNGAVYLYGPSVQENKKGKDPMTHYQIAKISGGKIDFLKAYPFKDMQAKMLKPSTQKTILELTGENEKTTGITILNNGDMFFCYQSCEMVGKNSTAKDIAVYRDMFMFQFDASGDLKKNYGIELTKIKAKDDYIDALENPAFNYFYPSGDGKSLYWFIASPKEMASTNYSEDVSNALGDMSVGRKSWRALKGIDYTSINIETGDLSGMKTIGNEQKNPFYLFGSEMVKPMKSGNFVYFFEENEKGSAMRLTRVDISK